MERTAIDNDLGIVVSGSGLIEYITARDYQWSAADRAGNVLRDANGDIEYKAEVTKVVHVSAKFSDANVLRVRQQAVASGVGEVRAAGLIVYNSGEGGIDFGVLMNHSTGRITNFFPK
ncbi:CdiA family toxin C-terminal domain-containing protein [Roseateles amylovorans]|uniref:CdiA family toxin C-terminal domain-containing protein n=1 Tax=Roseateles amylovorans TaxID=2978473 RepID=A0ABY6B071_9BURK|nr:CdiA family toxin C-terminal domain-containing protein [Roseateles amylovorans]UXH77374.1 CdiA family toxin C-terminal domain-containing protein [Roseateles amylovorans]